MTVLPREGATQLHVHAPLLAARSQPVVLSAEVGAPLATPRDESAIGGGRTV